MLLHRSGDRRPPASHRQHQRDQGHDQGGRGLEADPQQGQHVLDQVGISALAERPLRGCGGHQFCGVKPPTAPRTWCTRRGYSFGVNPPAQLRPGAGVIGSVVVVGQALAAGLLCPL